MDIEACVLNADTIRLFASSQNIFGGDQVETLGDKVYMVAGGVPDRRADHADRGYSEVCSLVSGDR